MKKILILIYTSTLQILCGALFAEGGPEELGHHWDIPAYSNEIHFQLAAMLIIAIIAVAIDTYYKKNRSNGNEK